VAASGATTAYRYVSDGRLAAELNRSRVAILGRPRLVVPFVVASLLFGVGASLVDNAASLPTYLGRVVLIGLMWGTVWLLFMVLCAGVISLPVGRAINRAWVARKFPEGSVTTVELGPDSILIERPTGLRSLPYAEVRRVRSSGFFWQLQLRGRPFVEVLPREMLPDSAVELIRARSRGVAPMSSAEPGRPTRETVVPPGWAGHVAALQVGRTLRERRFWTRSAPVLLISGLATAVFGGAWVIGGVAWCVFNVGCTYVVTRRNVSAALPTGSTASTFFFDDRCVSRNTGGSREVRFTDIEAADVHDDVVFLRLRDHRGALVLARALVPDDALENLRS
jgi:hypothetical protein